MTRFLSTPSLRGDVVAAAIHHLRARPSGPSMDRVVASLLAMTRRVLVASTSIRTGTSQSLRGAAGDAAIHRRPEQPRSPSMDRVVASLLAMTMLGFATPAHAATGEAVNPWVALAYLASGVFFILALRGLSSPATSRTGNRFGMVGMTIAVVTTLVTHLPMSAPVSETPVGIDVACVHDCVQRFDLFSMGEILVAIAIPIIPKRLPVRLVAGEDRPRSARMKTTPDTR